MVRANNKKRSSISYRLCRVARKRRAPGVVVGPQPIILRPIDQAAGRHQLRIIRELSELAKPPAR
jgi:hypothetical protein